MKKIKNTPFFYLTVLTILAACSGTVKNTPIAGDALDSLNGNAQATEVRLATEANAAIKAGKTNDALLKYETLYTKSITTDPKTALNYAQLLRKKGQHEKAIKVLSSWAETKRGRLKTSADPAVVNELAANFLEIGKVDKAEKLLDAVINNPDLKDYHADAYNLRGVELSAKGQHKDAEQFFRQALDTWKGDATSVKNNLAVCLATQGKFDQALTLLRQALIEAPDKTEIAKNIDLISGIRNSIIPKPRRK